MNERIKELAEQAGWMMGDDVEGFNIRLEKFTKLIVRECCDVLFESEHGRYQVNYVLKEHFGVEE